MKLPPVAAKLLKKRASGGGLGARFGALPRSTWYAVITAVLTLGFGASVLDVMARGDKERAYGERSKQRLVFVGEQGEAGTTATPKDKDAGDFEVEEESPEERKLRAAQKKDAPAETVKDAKEETPAEPVDDVAPDAAEPAPADGADIAEEAEASVEVPEATEKDDAAADADIVEAEAPEAAAESTEVVQGNTQGLEVLSNAKPDAVPNIKPGEGSLIFAPAREVSKQTKAGMLPVVGEKGARPFDVYQRSFRPTEGKSMLGIVITGMGFSAAGMNLALAMPPEVTLSFSPYASGVAGHIDSVRNAGHEVWFDLPTQTADYPTTDPGPLGIISTLNAKDRDGRLERMMIATRGAVGAIFPLNDALRGADTVFQGTVKTIRDHGMEVFYGEQDSPKIASKEKLKRPSHYLLASSSPTKLASELAAIRKSLNDTTPVIIYAQGSPHVLKAIAEFVSADVKKLPVSLAPLSAFYMDYAAIAAEEAAAAEAAGKDEKKGGH